MVNYRVSALESVLVNSIRTSLVDAFENVLAVETVGANSRLVCRHCLTNAKPGERVILFSYLPPERMNAYREIGPVYIHADVCERYTNCEVFPTEIAEGRTLALRGYSKAQKIVDCLLGSGLEIEKGITELFSDPEISFIHVRNASYGCFLCKVERITI